MTPPADMVTAAVTATLREMRWWDLEEVLALENALFPDDAWSPGMFWSELARARGSAASRRYLVAELEVPPRSGDVEGRRSGDGREARLVGYGGLAAVDGTGDIQTIATARDQWGSGLGGRLLGELLSAATAFECHEVLLEVRVDNLRAQRLYERFGFAPLGFRRGYYQPGNVDALVMRRPATDPDTEAGTEPGTGGDVTSASDAAPDSPFAQGT